LVYTGFFVGWLVMLTIRLDALRRDYEASDTHNLRQFRMFHCWIKKHRPEPNRDADPADWWKEEK